MKDNTLNNKEVARLLRNIAASYLLQGENQFKVIAYQKAADTIEHLNREIRDIWQDQRLGEVPSIGKSISAYLDELFRTGQVKHFNKVMGRLPAPVFELMTVPTIGPKTAARLVKALDLEKSKDIFSDVKKAAASGKIASIETFGDKSQAEILEVINRFQHKSTQVERMVLPIAFSLANEVVDYLKKHPAVIRVDMLGSLRRMLATVGDIDLLAEVKSQNSKVKSYKDMINHFIKYPKTIKVDNAGENKASIIIRPNVRVDLRIQDKENYGPMLQYFTGSKTHNINLRTYALKKGYSLSEYGIKKVKNAIKNSKVYEFDSEYSFYQFLGLQYIPPEIREGTDEIEMAIQNKLPYLVEISDIKGDLHLHSSYDLKPSHDMGNNPFEEIVDAAKKRNYDYIGFSEHNPKVSNLTKEEIVAIMKKRQQEIERLRDLEIKVFNGLEVDIQPNGEIALPIEAIKYVDYLIVSVHSVFNLDRITMTKRVLKALSYPKVKILGHPTGRMLGRRDGFELDWETIFTICKNKNIALEINSWFTRLDLPDTLVREGLNYGVKYIINTDAHDISEMNNMIYGVAVARRGWCQSSDIINTLGSNKIRKWFLESGN